MQATFATTRVARGLGIFACTGSVVPTTFLCNNTPHDIRPIFPYHACAWTSLRWRDPIRRSYMDLMNQICLHDAAPAHERTMDNPRVHGSLIIRFQSSLHGSSVSPDVSRPIIDISWNDAHDLSKLSTLLYPKEHRFVLTVVGIGELFCP